MRKLVHLTLLLLVTSLSSQAADRYWRGLGFGNWSLPTSWSATPTGPVGATVPGPGDVAIFSNVGTGLVIFDLPSITAQKIRIENNYSGTFILGATTLTLTGDAGGIGFEQFSQTATFIVSPIGGNFQCLGDFVQTAGSFNIANPGIHTIAGDLTLDGTPAVLPAFNITNNVTLIIGGNFTMLNPSTFAADANTTVIFRKTANGTQTVQIANNANTNASFANVVIDADANNTDDNRVVLQGATRMIVRDLLTMQSGRLNSPTSNAGVTLLGNMVSSGNLVSVGGAPGAVNTAILDFSGSGNQTINLVGADFDKWNGDILINKPADNTSTVQLLSPILLNGGANQTVTFINGIVLTAQPNILIFGNNVTTTGASNASHVDGPVEKRGVSGFTFPIGDAGYYGGISISGGTTFESNLASAATHVAEYLRVNPTTAGYPHTSLSPFAIANNFKVSECEYWNMQRTAGTADPVIWLSFDSDRSCGITAPNNLAVMAWIPPLTSYWEATGGVFTGSPANFRRSIGPVNFISGIYTLGTNNVLANPLPVRWLSFTGRYFNAAVELNWSTSLEQNNDMFTVERSADGINYSAIGTVKGRGNASSTSVYNFVDPRPLSGTGHYRIKQTDRDGKISYSDVIRVSSSSPSMRGLRLFPNPAAGNIPLTLENSSWTNKKVNVTIFNAVGGIVYQDQVTFGADGRSKVNISSLQKGSYFVSTYLNGEKQTMPFLVQ